MKTIHDLKKMISEPASKEWFKKHGSPKSKALKEKKLTMADIRKSRLAKMSPEKRAQESKSIKEQHERLKGFNPHKVKIASREEQSEHQRKTGRGYNE